MLSKTPITLAIINNTGKVIGLKRNVTLANAKDHFPMRNGQPVIGPNVRRLFTIKEICANGLASSKNKAGDLLRDEPEKCIVPVETAIAA
jgi:hypothetical protein